MGRNIDLGIKKRRIVQFVGKKKETLGKPRETDAKPLQSVLSVFLTSVASEKVSKQSKIDSLAAENEHFIARSPNRGDSKPDFP